MIPALMPLEGKVLLSATAGHPASAVVIKGTTPHPHLSLNGTLRGGSTPEGNAIRLTSVSGNLTSIGRVIATGTLAYSAADRTLFGVITLSNRNGSLPISVTSHPQGAKTSNGRLRVAFTAVGGTGSYHGISNHGSGLVKVSAASDRFTATLNTLH